MIKRKYFDKFTNKKTYLFYNNKLFMNLRINTKYLTQVSLFPLHLRLQFITKMKKCRDVKIVK